MRSAIGLLTVLLVGMTAKPALAETRDFGIACNVAGRLSNLDQQVHRSGYAFHVGMRQLRYEGRVKKTLVEQTGPDRFTIWLALRDLNVTIGRTDISGAPGRATCGPMKVLLGNRRDLWIAFDVSHRVDEDESQLVLNDTRFQLPADNWQIGAPSRVQTSGFGMTRDQVVAGLRKGLAKNRARIAQRLIDAAPQILMHVASQSEDLPAIAINGITRNAAARRLTNSRSKRNGFMNRNSAMLSR